MSRDLFAKSDRIERLSDILLRVFVVTFVVAVLWSVIIGGIAWIPWALLVPLAIAQLVVLGIWGRELDRIGKLIEDDWRKALEAPFE